MKKFFALIIISCIILPVLAVQENVPQHKAKNFPQGTFKKKKDGTFVQYDNRGKKIGTYKLNSGSLTRIK